MSSTRRFISYAAAEENAAPKWIILPEGQEPPKGHMKWGRVTLRKFECSDKEFDKFVAEETSPRAFAQEWPGVEFVIPRTKQRNNPNFV